MQFQHDKVSYMFSRSNIVKIIALSIACIFFLLNTGQTTSLSIFPYPYTHYAEQESLQMLLVDFARTQGYAGSVSISVRGSVSGRFEKENPFKFLEGMKTAFGVSWYILGNTLYFYTETDVQRAFITPKVMTVERLYELLINSHVLSSQLPAELMNNGEMIVVYGPQSYLDQVLKAVAALEISQMSNIIMRVFPLKYAWADDITVGSMDKIITVPGIATILRAMLSGNPQVSPSVVVEQPATVEKLSGTGLAARGKPGNKDQGKNNVSMPVNNSSIMADPRMNAVIINDAAYKMPYYEEVIHDLDKPVELVEIQAAIVDVDSNYKYSLGFIFQGDYSRGSGKLGSYGTSSAASGTVPIKPPAGTIPTAGLGLSTIYTKGVDFFLSRVEALETEGEARVLGKPSVLTVDNIQATLENTSTYYIQIQGYQAVDLFKVDAGTILRVTPHIIKNMDGTKSIKLVVSVEDNQSDDSDDTPITPSNVLPPIKQTKINTQAIVGTGQSLLIGGYYYEQKSVSETGIPILMHIPVLGHLFKTTAKNTKQMERLILITPKIVNLNDLDPLPVHMQDAGFKQRVVNDEYVVKPKQGSGCSSKKTVPQTPSVKKSDVSCEKLLNRRNSVKQRPK